MNGNAERTIKARGSPRIVCNFVGFLPFYELVQSIIRGKWSEEFSFILWNTEAKRVLWFERKGKARG